MGERVAGGDVLPHEPVPQADRRLVEAVLQRPHGFDVAVPHVQGVQLPRPLAVQQRLLHRVDRGAGPQLVSERAVGLLRVRGVVGRLHDGLAAVVGVPQVGLAAVEVQVDRRHAGGVRGGVDGRLEGVLQRADGGLKGLRGGRLGGRVVGADADQARGVAVQQRGGRVGSHLPGGSQVVRVGLGGVGGGGRPGEGGGGRVVGGVQVAGVAGLGGDAA